MGWLDLLRFDRTPAGLTGSTLLLVQAATLDRAAGFIKLLQQRFANLAIVRIGSPGDSSPENLPQLTLTDDPQALGARLRKLQPERLVILGLDARYLAAVQAAGCPLHWINARDAAIGQADCKTVTVTLPTAALPAAMVTGDPLSGITQLPALSVNTGICQRFREQREGDRWLGYFAGTGENEEALAFRLFNRTIRHKMGVMLLAPRDSERCEPVYRDSLKYRLQTIRHRRLSTSWVPIKTRVYYIEDPQPLADLYACADFVVAGGTLDAASRAQPDLITPILHGRPVLVGPAHRNHPLVGAALDARVVLAGDDEEQMFTHICRIIDEPKAALERAGRAREWLASQPGAAQRVLAALG